jgi:alginate O-acetyltransferase complex protein AlgI
VRFNSPEFALLFAAAVLFSRWAPHRLRIWGLLGASLLFYGWWSVPFLGLLLFTIGVDYAVGLRLGFERSPRRRTLLLVGSLVANLGVLFVFKYLDFFLETWHLASSWSTGAAVPVAYRLILPLGISFYTFQSMSYTIDVYRGELRPCRDFAVFALFVTFFPQLVAGPIVRAADLIPQLERGPVHEEGRFREGFPLMAWGFVKKMILADRAAPFADAVFGDPALYGGPQILLGIYAFALQIYCDFSGYSDIAIGCARVMGYRFPVNFDGPYLATSIRGFWRRWHVSLSTWLRDYLYIPLGGSREGAWRRNRNLALTMLLGGLWHGAAWHFVAWGGFHGALLMLEQACESPWSRLTRTAVGRVVATAVTFHLVCFGWLLFRADSMSTVGTMLSRMCTSTPGEELGGAVYALLAGMGIVLWVEKTRPLSGLLRGSGFAATLASWAGGLAAVTLGAPSAIPFIYFQF